MAEVIYARAPVAALLTIVLILIASVATFWILIRRWTTERRRTALKEWARPANFTISFLEDRPDIPVPLTPLAQPGSHVNLRLQNQTTDIVQLETTDPPAGQAQGPFRWNLLVRKIETPWRATGLRPVAHRVSALDFFSLSSFPSLGETDRFVVFGTDSTAARSLSKSMGRALLPPDVGLLLSGSHLILDFSTRPFDTIEFGRMMALADQLAGKLPAPV